MTEPLPEQYLEGIRLFNEEDFFECHDELEELWAETQGERRLYLQGMIQAAVALFHFGNENLGGARKLCDACLQKLDQYPAVYMGIDLERFRADFRNCFQELLGAHDRYPAGVELQDELVPKIEFVEEAV